MLTFLSQNPRKAHLLSLLAIFLCVLYSSACTATSSGGTPSVTTTTTTTTTTTSATPSGCCPALVQTNTSNTNFIDGFMTFVYNSDTCRTSVTITCTSTQNPTLNAGIIANSNNFLATGVGSVSFPGTCDGNGNWLVGTPSLVVQTLQCQLTQAT